MGKKRIKRDGEPRGEGEKKIGPKPDRKRLVPEGVRDFLGWKPRSVYPLSRRLTWMRTAGPFVAHLGLRGYLMETLALPCCVFRGVVACDVC